MLLFPEGLDMLCKGILQAIYATSVSAQLIKEFKMTTSYTGIINSPNYIRDFKR